MNPEIRLVASGDSRLAPNQTGWPAQQQLEATLARAFERHGRKLVRAHQPDPGKQHGFVDGQARGLEVFRGIDPNVPLVVATAVWQYSMHVLPGLVRHRGPILTVANWSGRWPGLVGLLNLNGSLTKAEVEYSSVWSVDFEDEFAGRCIAEWLEKGRVVHDRSHVRPLEGESVAPGLETSERIGRDLGRQLLDQQAIMGVFDEGCMGMFNAIVPDHLLHEIGIFKERFSQSDLYALMLEVPDSTARVHMNWLLERGMEFHLGEDPARELTEAQVREGLKMYDAAVRLTAQHRCDVIGIQYQQGLQRLCVSSDLAEGLLNNPDRPPVRNGTGQPLLDGRAIPHFNEVDECAGVDALLTNRVWTALGLDPSTTLHDVRWGEAVDDWGIRDFVWVFEISGAVPASHLVGGYRGARGERQPSMYFKRGGSTLKGVSRPGEIVWSRIYVAEGSLSMDIGRGGVVELPPEETERRWQATTPQWPIMHAVLYGTSRDQFMAQHKANHVQVAYAPGGQQALQALAGKAAMARALGIKVNLCGELDDSLERHQSRAGER